MVEDSEGLRRLRPSWTALEAQAGPVQPFISWDWQASWWEAFGQGLALRCLVVGPPGDPVGIVPLYASRSEPGWLRFGGGLDVTDHLGFLSFPGRELEVATAALQWALQHAPGQALDLHFLVEGSAPLQALRAAADALGVHREDLPETVSPHLELASDFDVFLSQGLGKKDRHELRRKRRRLDQERPGWRLVDQGELGLEPALDTFFELVRSSGQHKTAFLTPEVQAFMRRLALRLQERGWLRLQLLEAGGQLLAATFGFTVAGTWNLYNSGYRAELGALSPGLLCVAEGIRVAIGEGCHSADFLRGDEAYKYHLGARDRTLWRLQIRGGDAT